MSDTSAPASPDLEPSVRESTFIVIAAYNEGEVLGHVIDGVRALYPNVVVVDDGSRDNTFEVASRHARWALRHVINRGQGAALQTGISFALQQGARFVVTFDADGQHQVSDLRAMLAPIAAGECEICLGSRFLGSAVNMPTMRRITLRMAILFTRIFSGAKLTDTHNGFRAFSRRAAQQMNIRLDRMAHASELIDQVHRSGLGYREIPVEIHYTEWSMHKGQSSRGAFRVAFDYLLGRIIS